MYSFTFTKSLQVLQKIPCRVSSAVHFHMCVRMKTHKSGKILNKVNSVKLCDLHKKTMEKSS
jgi:hypothetical protein